MNLYYDASQSGAYPDKSLLPEAKEWIIAYSASNMFGGLCLSLGGGEDVLPCLSDNGRSIARWPRLDSVNEQYRPLFRMMLDNNIYVS